MNLEQNYQGKKVLITGNTGFKGSWMANWLVKMGAIVKGYSLHPTTNPSHFKLLNNEYQTFFENINDLDAFKKVLNDFEPEIVFHLAAQPLVRYSYSNPIETFQTNFIGTLNVLEAVRLNENIKAVVIVTTDKCYENLEQVKGYLESDRMGGFDPYSCSKGCAELLVNSYRNSFFNSKKYMLEHRTLVASARAGNVIGGGDWSTDRLIPDIIRSTVEGKITDIRNPKSTRPWQHVLEPISGYFHLGVKLLAGDVDFAEAWNFGPEENQCLSVNEVLEKSRNYWSDINYEFKIDKNNVHEAVLLSLNIDKAKSKLNWQPRWDNEITIQRTILWYKNFYLNGVINTDSDLEAFLNVTNF